MNYDQVIAVNENDEVLDYLDKQEVHEKGILHRAISVFIVNSRGEWLLQQRAAHKYHSGLLWTNASCTHPMRGESNLEAAQRRLQEEMGIAADLKELFSFKYHAELDNELIEHELDHVFVGCSDEIPVPNPEEVAHYRYLKIAQLKKELSKHPEHFTAWFRLLFQRVSDAINT